MQMQMEVLDLDECDFLETSFKEYEQEEDFIKDGSFSKTALNKKKVLFCVLIMAHHLYINMHLYLLIIIKTMNYGKTIL